MSVSGDGSVNAARRVTLDGMRGFAALLVAIYHFQQFTGYQGIAGYLAVDLFFCISGYVLAEVYCPRFTAGLRPVPFIVQRFIRFYPLYLAGLAIGILMVVFCPPAEGVVLAPGFVGRALVYGLAMVPTPEGLLLYPFNGASWSLAYELGANLLLALVLWRMSARTLALIVAIAFYILTQAVHDPEHLNVGWGWPGAGAAAIRTLFSFTLGVLLYRVAGGWRIRWRWLAPLPILGTLAAMILMPGNGWENVLELAAVALLFPACVMVAAAVEPPRMLAPLMHWLGALSFPLYAIHWPLVILMQPVLRAMGPWQGGVTFAVTALALAWAVDRFVDRPAQRWWKARSRSRRATVATALA